MPNTPSAVIEDPVRIDALRSYQIVDTAPEAAFDDLAQLAANTFDAPEAHVTFVEANRQFFKASAGAGGIREAALYAGFCAYTVANQDTLVIPDTWRDPLYANNPAVTGPPFVRFYVGVPLRSPEGQILGTLCVLDQKPHQPPDQRLNALRMLGRQVESLLALRRLRSAQAQLVFEQTRITQERDAVSASRDAAYDARREAEDALRLNTIQQRRFVREMLASVTEGKLCLCDGASDLPDLLPPASDTVEMTPKNLRVLRKHVEAVTRELELTEERVHDLLTAVGEAAMNAVKYGGGGTGRVHADLDRGIIQVRIQDQGTGIREEDLHRATLEKGWSGSGSLGHGFYLMLRTVDRTYLLTGAQGTTVILEQERTPPEPAWLQDK